MRGCCGLSAVRRATDNAGPPGRRKQWPYTQVRPARYEPNDLTHSVPTHSSAPAAPRQAEASPALKSERACRRGDREPARSRRLADGELTTATRQSEKTTASCH